MAGYSPSTDPYVCAARRLLRDPLAEQIVAMLLRAWDEEESCRGELLRAQRELERLRRAADLAARRDEVER
jgi:hypothetical protein